MSLRFQMWISSCVCVSYIYVCIHTHTHTKNGFSQVVLVVKNPPPNSWDIRDEGSICKRCGFNLWVGKIAWRREWQPTSVFFSGESHGQRNLVGYRPWGSQSRTALKWEHAYTKITCTSVLVEFIVEVLSINRIKINIFGLSKWRNED